MTPRLEYLAFTLAVIGAIWLAAWLLGTALALFAPEEKKHD